MLLVPKRNRAVRREIAIGLSRYPFLAKAGVANLTAALKDSEPATLIAVADALAQAGSDAKSAAASLAPMLEHKEKGIRRAAVIALGRIAPEGALGDCRNDGPHARHREGPRHADRAGRVTGSARGEVRRGDRVHSSSCSPTRRKSFAGGPRERWEGSEPRAGPAADALLKAANSETVKDIRVDAVRAFGSALGPGLKGRVKDILAILKDREYEVRLAVVEEVGALGNELKDDVETLRVLRGRLSDPHVRVREAASIAIKKIEKKPEAKDPKKTPFD